MLELTIDGRKGTFVVDMILEVLSQKRLLALMTECREISTVMIPRYIGKS
jgi:hypothetical protein